MHKLRGNMQLTDTSLGVADGCTLHVSRGSLVDGVQAAPHDRHVCCDAVGIEVLQVVRDLSDRYGLVGV